MNNTISDGSHFESRQVPDSWTAKEFPDHETNVAKVRVSRRHLLGCELGKADHPAPPQVCYGNDFA